MSSRLIELGKVFNDLGVVNMKPGFYDEPAFMEAERRFPDLLDYYAEYCVLTAECADRTNIEERLFRVISFLSPLIAAEGRHGRCLSTTLLVQRFLDAEGIWNFPQKGGIVVCFPLHSGLPPKVFEPSDVSGGTYGHAWNVAPPFMIDLTISRQFYTPAEERYISGDLITKDFSKEPEPAFSEFGDPSGTIRRLFPPFTVSLDQCSISYYPYGTGGPLEKFAEMQEPILNGLRPFDLFQRFCQFKTGEIGLRSGPH